MYTQVECIFFSPTAKESHAKATTLKSEDNHHPESHPLTAVTNKYKQLEVTGKG